MNYENRLNAEWTEENTDTLKSLDGAECPCGSENEQNCADVTPEQLIERAKAAMMRAYAPYSEYWVGAALLTADGTVYEGCNIESATHTPTCCAERTAFFKAISEGKREFKAIAVVGGKKGKIADIFPPCGVCRQVMLEFCSQDFLIHMGGADGITTVTLAELIPYGISSNSYM